jgi:hypothetical protein
MSDEDEGVLMARLRIEAFGTPLVLPAEGVDAQTFIAEKVSCEMPSRVSEHLSHFSPEPPAGMTERLIWREAKSMTMLKVYHVLVVSALV